MNKGIFITGTNTNIGKTFISALLLTSLVSAGINARYFKPVQTGEDSDCDTVKNLTGASEDFIVRPVFRYQAPQTPYLAARLENKILDPNLIFAQWQNLENNFYIVEGAGGLLAPVARNCLIRDLIKQLDLPLLIVASTQLGTMNHTLLTIEAAQAANIVIKGIILSGTHNPGQKEIIQEFTSVPILAEIPWQDSVPNMQSLAKKYFDQKLLNIITN